MSSDPDDLADNWAEIKESLTDALVEYKEGNPDLIALMEKHPNYNTIIWENVAAAGARIDRSQLLF